MAELINFDEQTPHMVRTAVCGLCKEKHIGVIPVSINTQLGLECHKCGQMTCLFELNNPDPEEPPKSFA